MSKFKQLIETVFLEYDRDDPSDNFWAASKEYKQAEYEKNTLASKNINPLKPTDLVYVKAIFVSTDSYKTSVFYISNKQKSNPYVKNKQEATKFSVVEGEKFIKHYPKEIVKNKNNQSFERHFELEKC